MKEKHIMSKNWSLSWSYNWLPTSCDLFCLLGMLLLFYGCAGQVRQKSEIEIEKKYSTEIENFYIEGRLHAQNKQQNKTYSLSGEALIHGLDRMRLSLMGPFQKSVARAVLDEQQFVLALDQQRKYLSGQVGPESLKPLFGVAIDPRDLLLFLRAEIPSGWSCDQQQKMVCKNKDKTMVYERLTNKSGADATWSVEGKEFKITFMPVATRTKVQLKTNSFLITIPDSYKKFE